MCVAGQSAANTQGSAESIYFGGDILTMAGAQPAYIQALAIHDGKIIAAGNRDDLRQCEQASTRLIDLQGKTLLPGFYDAERHDQNPPQEALH